jgi:ketosteroid isomerase-like protein
VADDDSGLLEANLAFYRAFATSDLAGMDALWARKASVACTHPSGETILGRAQVMAGWRALFLAGNAPPIVAREAVPHPCGEAGFVTCIEAVPGATLAATNIFLREDGRWKMVHHHAAPQVRQLQRAPPSKPPPKGPVLN